MNDVTTRLDIWLWAARFFKTRSLAKHAIEGGKVEVNDDSVAKPARALHVGDRLRITRGEERFGIEVLALDDRRGSAEVAQALYRETDASRAARESLREQRRLTGAAFAQPKSKPDKHARRELLNFKERRGE